MKSNPISVVTLTAALLGVTFLPGCVESTGGSRPSGGAAPGTPTAAEQGCLRDVTRTTNNPDVVLLSSSFSQAGTEVIVGVGPQQARWRCIGYEDGTTSSIMSLTDEGRL